MKIEQLEDAFDKLADMVWWLKGFAAARPPSTDEGDGAHLSLRDHADELRRFLWRLVSGGQRRIAYRGEERILIDLSELEQMRDAIEGAMPYIPLNTRDREQLERGVHAARAITSQYGEEERAAHEDPTLPF